MSCPLCFLGHANHTCANDMIVGRESDDDGSVDFYGKWFSIHNPYYFDGIHDIALQWDGCMVGYDGLDQKTYDCGQEIMAWANEKYAEYLGDNKPILSDEKAIEIVKEIHKEFYIRLKN